MKRFNLHIILFFLTLSSSNAQTFFPLNSFFDEFKLEKNTENLSVKPLILNYSILKKDSLINKSIYKNIPGFNNWFIRKLRYEHFFIARDKNFELNLSPLLILEFGQEEERKIYRNTRGIFVEGTIGNKMGFYSAFHENQSQLMTHIAGFADYYGVIPGQGFHKPFKKIDYDYAWSEGMLLFQPSKNINIQFGHGKRFVGNGYRSMLYSDNSFAYPHVYLEYTYNKIRYSTWFTSFMNLDFPEPRITLNHQWQRKAGVFHYLTYQFSDFFELGFFEGSILNSRDNKGYYTFDIRHYNPIILTNNFFKETNNFIGTNLNLKFEQVNIFGQFLLNPQKASKNGFQFGAKYKYVLPYLMFSLQSEINHASKGIYSFSDSILSYTHYNQPLAHPLGENFTELVIKSTFRLRSVELEYKYNYAISNSDSTGILPALNLFYPDNEMISFSKKSIRKIHEIKLSYIINPQYNMRFTLGIFLRNFNYNTSISETSFLYLSFQTPIFNRYYDF